MFSCRRRAISLPLVAILIATGILTYHTYNREVIDKKTWLAELETKGYSYSTLTITIDKVLLEGKPFYETSKLIMIVHNFTKCPSVLLYHGKFKSKLTFKIFVKLVKLRPIEGGVVPIVTPVHNYAITIIYWNGKELYDAVAVVEVVPNEPVLVKTVSFNLTKTPKVATESTPSFGHLFLLQGEEQSS